MNSDGKFDSSDVVLLVNALSDPTPPSGLPAVIADANQDGLMNTADVDRVVDIILGLETPRPIGLGQTAVVTVSFHRVEEPLADERSAIPIPVSFWFQPTPPAVTEVNAEPAHASLWFIPPEPTPQEQNTSPNAASFWRPPPVPAATEVDAVQRGAPSFDRQ
jgi:hypothetical protein